MDSNMEKDIFIAEDDPVALVLLEQNLRIWGHDPLVSTNGKKALEILKGPESPNIVLLDWMMPGLDGIEVVRELRKSQRDIPHYIIMITSKKELSDIISALEAGADDFISKPFDPGELRARIDAGIRTISLQEKLVNARNEARKLADFISHYDPLTGLPNRATFKDRVRQHCASSHPALLMMVNIDRFRVLNQARGLEIGDALLTHFGSRLKALFPEEITVAHFAADEFGILIPSAEPTDYSKMIEEIHHVTDDIHHALKSPFSIDKGITVTASIGAVPLKTGGKTAEEFLRRADTALKRAKKNGGNQTVIYDAHMELEIQERYAIERDLLHGIEANHLHIYLQPQVTLDGNLEGAEVLIRWMDPSKGLISPETFISVSEESDLIITLDKLTLHEACLLLANHREQPFSLSVNISPKHFHRSNFIEDIKEALSQTNAPPERLILEVTEGLLLKGFEEVEAKMHTLSELGIRFSIDDFGQGYSSLAYLKKLPISELKIDKAFVDGIPTDKNDIILVKTIYAMASNLGLTVVAEGVETEEQVTFLKQLGKMLFQGYYYSKPAPAHEILQKWVG